MSDKDYKEFGFDSTSYEVGLIPSVSQVKRRQAERWCRVVHHLLGQQGSEPLSEDDLDALANREDVMTFLQTKGLWPPPNPYCFKASGLTD